MYKLPLKILSPFFTRMAKEARTDQTLNLIPAPWTSPRSVKTMQWSVPGRMQTGSRCAAHGSLALRTSDPHVQRCAAQAIKSVWSSCWCGKGWLCWSLWGRSESINLLLYISSLLLNSIIWYRMHTCFGAFDVSCALGHYVCTNRIVPLNHWKATRNFEPCLCNEAHNEWGEWHDCSGSLLLNALL